MWQIWLIIAGVCFIIEIMTVVFLIFWSAIGLNDINIPQGTKVEIKEIQGVKAIVAPIQKLN